jgi:aminoglycoside 6'-N-acetyltransferase I
VAPPLEVRLLSPTDVRVLDRLDDGVFDNPVRPELVQAFFSNPANLLAVAISDGVVVGMASGIVYVHPDKPPQLFINEVGVSERFHRQGIGKRLVATLLQRSGELGCTEAWVATEEGNAGARALYAALGGREDAERAVVYTYSPGGAAASGQGENSATSSTGDT